MQVNSSVNNRYYIPYHTNKSVKYRTGFKQTEAGKLPINMLYSKNQDNSAYAKTGLEAFGIDTLRPFSINGRSFHFDGDEQIILGSGQKVNSDYQKNTMSGDVEPVYAKQTEAVSIAETEDAGDFLGLTMVPEEGQSVTYGMRAMLSDKSTPDNPIVQVVSNLGGKKVIYNVEVNKVNPNNATQLEMFALLSYTDKMGITDGGTFGSHQQLEVYGGSASRIGYCNSLSGADVFLNESFDWTSIMEKMVQVYQDAGTLLTTEYTSCVYETATPNDDALHYITWYTEEGIFCRKEGQTEGYEWSIAFENREQYDKVMEFIRQFPSDWNMRFAAHENFWNDFLNDKIDMDGFMEFINGTDKGVPDFSVTEGNSMYFDKDKMQWAKYTNSFVERVYTAEELHKAVDEEEKITKLQRNKMIWRTKK